MKLKQTVILLAMIAMTTIGLSMGYAHTTAAATKCGDVDTAIIGGDICAGVNNKSANSQDNAIWKLLTFIIKIMTVGVGVAAVGGIVYGAILYTSAADSSEQVKKAIEIIRNVIIGLLAYAFMFAFLNYLIPGGIFT